MISRFRALQESCSVDSNRPRPTSVGPVSSLLVDSAVGSSVFSYAPRRPCATAEIWSERRRACILRSRRPLPRLPESAGADGVCDSAKSVYFSLSMGLRLRKKRVSSYAFQKKWMDMECSCVASNSTKNFLYGINQSDSVVSFFRGELAGWDIPFCNGVAVRLVFGELCRNRSQVRNHQFVYL